MKITYLIPVLFLFLNFISLSQDQSEKLLEQIDENSYRIDNIFINSQERTVEFPAWVNMNKGLIEVLVCAPGGKDHEAVFIANVVPSYLNSALLLLGLERNENLNYDPRSPNIVGPELDIKVQWQDDGSTKEFPAENCLINIPDSSMVEDIKWVYTGSFSQGGHYAADNVKSLITTYNDLTTVIDNGSESGSDDTLFDANGSLVPPKYTDVKIIIQVKKE